MIYKYDLLKEITFYISSIIQNQKESLLDVINKELFQQIKVQYKSEIFRDLLLLNYKYIF